MIATSDFRKGMKIEFKGDPYEIVDFQHVKMGRGGANVKTKMRNLRTGSVIEETIRSGEKFPPPGLEEKKMQYLYAQDEHYYFMDLVVTKTDPGFKGDTASGGGKPATLETGAVVRVPFHINEGDTIKVDTRTSEYIERVK